MKESILILGASALQLPLINYVKSRGYRVIVVSIPGDYPGFEYADRSIYCDIRDGEKILESINGENIVGVLTDQTDISVPTVAYLSTQLGLPGTPLEIAQIYSNKNLFRNACDKIGIPNLCHIRICRSEDALDWSIYPAMLKPEDSQGSRGVYKVNSYNELCNVLASTISYSHSGYAILEEFFVGQEVVLEGFVQNGEYINFGVGDRKYFDIVDKFIPSQTIFPSTLKKLLVDRLLDVEKRIHSYLSPRFGMIHSEYLINVESGEFRVIETALRGGGVYISSHLIPLYTGYNNYELLLDTALGKVVDLNAISQSFYQKASAYVCFYLPDGEINSIDGVNELSNLDGVNLYELSNLFVGKKITPMQNKTQRLGPIILYANNRNYLESLMYKIRNILNIKVLTTEGSLKSINW